jgi:hypothetical protein
MDSVFDVLYMDGKITFPMDLVYERVEDNLSNGSGLTSEDHPNPWETSKH